MPTPSGALAFRMSAPDPGPGPSNARPAPPDEDVRRAQAGDTAAFERLYRAHAPRVFALALRLTGDRAAAEELLQDTFVRAWERLGGFRGEATLASWLHRLTVTVLLGEARSARRRDARAQRAAPPDPADTTVAAEDAPLDRIDLERALATLPPGARLVFVLHDIEGWRHDEIARLTGNAPATMRAQLHRARHLLMERLDR